MKININNVGNDGFTGSRHSIGVNAIDVHVGGRDLELPMIVPNRIELEYSRISRHQMRMPLIQMVQRVMNISEIRNTRKQTEITENYERLLTGNRHALGDLYLQYPQDNTLQQADRETIHAIQVNAGALILSDYELDRTQSADDFEAQILQSLQEYPKHVVSPTLDIGIQDEGLFAKKVDKILENDFDRFNVIFRSIPQNITNWIDLSTKIFGKKVWCNVVGTIPRWHGKTRISQVSRVFLFGAHSVSMGYPWRGTPDAPAYSFDANTHCFVLANHGITYEQSRTQNVFTQRVQNSTARRHIIAGTYFTDYVLNRNGLQRSLVAIT